MFHRLFAAVAVAVSINSYMMNSANGELVAAWYFEGDQFLNDSIGTATLGIVGANPSATTQAGGSVSFDGSNGSALRTSSPVDLIPGSSSQFSLELLFRLDAIPTARASLINEVTNFGTSTRGFDLYLGNTGNIVTEVGNTNNTSSTFASSSDTNNSSNPFTLVAGKDYRLGAVYDFSGVNFDVSNFEAYTVDYLVENLTDGTAFSTTISRTTRNVANNTSSLFTIGGRFDNAGTSVVNSLDVDIEAVGIHNTLISELTLGPTAVPEPSSFALVLMGGASLAFRRRRA